MDNIEATNQTWFSTHWFQPEVLSAFDWANKELLLLLFVIPLAFLIKWFVNKGLGQKLPLALPKEQIKWSPIVLLRFVPNMFMFLALVCIVIAKVLI